MATQKTENFADNYSKLEKSVQRLRTTEVSDVDELVSIIDGAVEAYRACAARLDTIQSLTGEKLKGATEENSV